MQLKDWLVKTAMSRTQFGRLMHVDRTVVHRWYNGQSLPGPEYMAEIYRVTGGEVAPNDFYRLPRIQPPRRRITPIVSIDDDLPLSKTGTR